MEYLGIDFSCALGSLRNGNFPDKDCLFPLISKLLGYAIVAASTTVKLPQILKILKHRSVRGLNMLSFELEVVGYTIALAYCLHKGLPFSAYGELLFLLIQAFVLVAIIYYYSQPVSMTTWFRALLYCAVAPTILAGKMDPYLFEALYASEHAIFLFARIPQIWRNFSGTISELIWMGTGEDSTAKPSKPSSSTSSTQIPLAPSYPDWSSSMQAYYAPGVPPPPFFASTVASPTPHPYLWGSQHPLIPPYGTPIPYSAIYPPGSVYAHPSMATAPSTTQHGTESVGKGPDGKYQVSTKNPKGMSANTSSKTGDNGKAGSGSGNDAISQSAESGSEGSSDASDENTNQQESATNKKRSFNQMLVDGANTQNNSVGATAVPGKPVVSTMSATILNIGMELWNASSAPAAVTPSTITGREVTLGDQWTQDERELKRQKRKQSNRESARRSRLRKQAECEELQKRVESLGNENQTLREELQRVSEECEKLTSENNSTKEELKRLCGPEAVANVE